MGQRRNLEEIHSEGHSVATVPERPVGISRFHVKNEMVNYTLKSWIVCGLDRKTTNAKYELESLKMGM